MNMTEMIDEYDEFIQKVKRIGNLGSAQSLLNWDQQVMMPPEGTPARSQQLSVISALQHELLTDTKMGSHLETLAQAELSGEQQAVVREVRREYDRAIAVPTELIEKITKTSSESLPVWEQAREENDFELFAPKLAELVELKREYAHHIDPGRDPYAVLFDDYEPYLDISTAEQILARLRDELVPLIEAVSENQIDHSTPGNGTFDAETQRKVCQAVLDTLGYNWDRGRFDTAPHPFSMGTMYDARVTTRYDESDPFDGLMSTIHEFGHAAYTLGLPDEHYATPLGQARDMTIHESQSRLWENHIGRSHEFWELIRPILIDHFPSLEKLTVGSMYQMTNQVYPDNLIRVEADELTYHMHIILRFEIERKLINNELSVTEVPQVWQDKMVEYLGVKPETDSAGCLQDIHWSHGSFGYFPTYSLGSVLAAQLFTAANATIDNLQSQIRHGEFDAFHTWLTNNVHQYGCQYTTPDLIQQATGEEFSAEYFIKNLTEKFTALYEL